MIPDSTTTLRYASYGNPLDVLTVDTVPIPPPGTGEVLLRLLYSTINPSDLGMIQGSYGRLPDLPAVPGREGIAEVVAVGYEVEELEIGDWVRLPELRGTWRNYSVALAEGLGKIPNDLPPEILVGASVNLPTAVRVLADFETLAPGDWVIQNAANSAVGEAVIRLAASRGIRTVNIVRRGELIEPLRAIGADVAVDESAEPDYPKRIRELTDHGLVRLGLNSVGGDSVMRLIKSVTNEATVVTFGGMTGEPIRFPTRYLIFNDIKLVGFWMDRWNRNATPYERNELLDTVYSLIRGGVFDTKIEGIYPLEQFREALEHNERPRFGKVLFRGPGS